MERRQSCENLRSFTWKTSRLQRERDWDSEIVEGLFVFAFWRFIVLERFAGCRLFVFNITFWENGLLPELIEGSGGGRRRRTVTVGRGDHAAGASGGRRGWYRWRKNGIGENFGGKWEVISGEWGKKVKTQVSEILINLFKMVKTWFCFYHHFYFEQWFSFYRVFEQ